MKKNILLILLITGKFAFSQSNLQFNKVKLVGSSPDTVPVGKLWKVESAIYSGEVAASYSVGYSSDIKVDDILVNNNVTVIRKSGVGSNSGAIMWEQNFPIWLPAGTILQTRNNVRYLSVVEFNAVN